MAPTAWAQPTPAPAAPRTVDARSEVGRALYDASATHAAELRADEQIPALKRAVEAAKTKGEAALAEEQERHVAALAWTTCGPGGTRRVRRRRP